MTDSRFWRPLASISECFNWCVKSKGVSGNPLGMPLPFNKDFIYLFLNPHLLGENSVLCYRWSDVK